MWSFPGHQSSVNLFRVILSPASQSCAPINTSWFVGGKNRTGIPSECAIHKERRLYYYRICDLTCLCYEPRFCGYLHFRVQFPPWATTKLLLCHIELMTSFPGFVSPDAHENFPWNFDQLGNVHVRGRGANSMMKYSCNICISVINFTLSKSMSVLYVISLTKLHGE